MAEIAFDETQFNRKARDFHAVSEKLNDGWSLNEKGGKIFLVKKKTISLKRKFKPEKLEDKAEAQLDDQIYSIEYHLLFHPSYQIPVFYFKCFSAGKIYFCC